MEGLERPVAQKAAFRPEAGLSAVLVVRNPDKAYPKAKKPFGNTESLLWKTKKPFRYHQFVFAKGKYLFRKANSLHRNGFFAFR